MTLIVGRLTPIDARVGGDMRITHPDTIRSGFLHAELKVILLSPTVCVAYAGLVRPALVAIRRVAKESDFGVIRDHLLQAHEACSGESDFLVAGLRPRKLVVIKDGQAVEGQAGWLGDGDAFAEYQFHYHQDLLIPPDEMYDSPQRAEDIEVATRMGSGFDAVLNGPRFVFEDGRRILTMPTGGSHPTVGEAIVYAIPRVPHDLFGYSHARRYQAPFSDSPPASGGFSAAAHGSFTYSLLSSDKPGVGAIGLYFDEGQLGVLYAPLLFDEPERYSTVSMKAFVELVRLKHGISLGGIA